MGIHIRKDNIMWGSTGFILESSYKFFGWILIVLLALTGCKSNKNERISEAKRPNIVFVFGDQWRAQAVGYAGNPDVKTPHIDQLSRESVVFNTAVSVDPVCTPFRASLITGQYPTTNGIFYNDRPLKNKELTIAEIYKKAGYNTGYIGKWHLNGHSPDQPAFSMRDKPVPRDRRQGFDFWKVAECTHNYNHSFYFDEGNQKHYWKGYDALAQTDTAVSYIHRMSKKDNPFLLLLSWGPPHSPYNAAPSKYKAMYDPATLHVRPNVPDSLQDEARKKLAGYYAQCTALDDAMGQLLKALDQDRIADNTIVVFTSDHGAMLLSRGMQKKQKPWDESIRTPLLMRYPEKLAHKEINQPINTPDILPTLLGLSDIDIPASIQGMDVSQALKGNEPYPKKAALIQFPVPFHQWNFMNGGKEYREVRTERYTYARDLNGPWLLYDNKQDPYQQHNLINDSDYKDKQQELDTMLKKKMDAVNDQFLPADQYMAKWGYHYDNDDSLRP